MTRIVTTEGLSKLHEELEERTTTIRQKIAGAIKEAKDQGDLSENAEYSAAKGEQAENEHRIAEIEAMVKDAEVIKHDDNDDHIQVGDKVTCSVRGKDFIFEIVGSNEADPAARKISNESPIGSALLGKLKGDKVQIATPTGDVTYEIKKVQ